MAWTSGAAGAGLAAAVLGLAGCGAEDARGSGSMSAAQRDAIEETMGASAAQERTPVEIKTAKCLLWPSNFRGACNFEPRGRGSFVVRLDDGKPFYDDVTEIFVSVYMEGHADVRVMTADGGSAMLGEAERSDSYPACWIGKGFSVCAY